MRSFVEAVPTWSDDKDVRAYHAVGNSLRERIRAGEFRDLGKLPPERELAERYNVGRAVIRDALVMLEVKGLVQSRQGSGIYITSDAHHVESGPADDRLPDRFFQGLAPAGPAELLEARQWLESHIARRAALSASTEDILTIEAAAHNHGRVVPGKARDNLEFHFHMRIAKATQNPEMVALASYLWKRRYGNRTWQKLVGDKDLNARLDWGGDHKRIVAALRDGDGDAAFVAAWQHVENIKSVLLCPQADARPDFTKRKHRKRA